MTSSLSETKTTEKQNLRKMWVEEIDYKGRKIVVVGAEYHLNYLDDGTTPKNWAKKIEGLIKQSSLVIMEYFPLELERNVYQIPVLGAIGKAYANSSNIEPFYSKITKMCKDQKKQIGVADIANTPQYLLYDLGPKFLPLINLPIGLTTSAVSLIQDMASKGHKHPTPQAIEKFLPAADDARRLFTAHAIIKEAERLIQGSTVLYIAPPAHSSRVHEYIKNGFSTTDSLRMTLYKCMIGLERSLRIYKTDKNGDWIRTANIKT